MACKEQPTCHAPFRPTFPQTDAGEARGWTLQVHLQGAGPPSLASATSRWDRKPSDKALRYKQGGGGICLRSPSPSAAVN